MTEDKLNIVMAMDSYLPTVDGVVMCMHNYCINAIKNHNVTVLAPKNHRKYIDKFPYKVIRCKSLHVPFLRVYYGFPKLDKKFKQKVYNEKIDIIHLHSPFNMANYAIDIAKERNIPIVATFHTSIRPIVKDVIKSRNITETVIKGIGKTYNQFDEIFVAIPAIAEQVKSYGYKGKITVMPFGTELQKVDNLDELKRKANDVFNLNEDDFVFIFVGRLVPLKRVDFSLEALKILKEKGYSFKFLIAGDGVYMNKLKSLVKDYNLQDNVKFLGMIDRETLPLLNARADLLLFPSIYDTFGLIKVEAATYDTPGVFIKNSRASYGVVDEHNGFLCENTVDDYANKIELAISDKEKLKQIGINAGKELYMNWEQCTDILIDRYKEIIKEKKVRLEREKIRNENLTKETKKRAKSFVSAQKKQDKIELKQYLKKEEQETK